jgi:23S rRNA (pseudouridine1915-N3)-methyltransferase
VRELLVLWVGKRASGPWQQLADEYLERIARFVRCTEVRLRPAEGRSGDPARALALEGEAILARVQPGDHLLALDECGCQLSTAELANTVTARLSTARIVFAVGSDLGLAPVVKQRAAEVVAMSHLTLPHQLARVLLLEQLYRSFDLQAGGAYHRGEVGGVAVGAYRERQRHRL